MFASPDSMYNSIEKYAQECTCWKVSLSLDILFKVCNMNVLLPVSLQLYVDNWTMTYRSRSDGPSLADKYNWKSNNESNIQTLSIKVFEKYIKQITHEKNLIKSLVFRKGVTRIFLGSVTYFGGLKGQIIYFFDFLHCWKHDLFKFI